MNKRERHIFALRSVASGIDTEQLRLSDDQEYHGLSDADLLAICQELEAYAVTLVQRIYRLEGK